MSTVKLNLAELVEANVIDQSLANILEANAVPERRGTIVVNVLLIFGALAVAAGVLALAPSATTSLILAGLALSIAGGVKLFLKDFRCDLLGTAFAIMGTLGLCGWVAMEAETLGAYAWPELIVFLIMTVGAIVFRSALLSAFAVLSLGAVLGSGTSYWFASYALYVREATLTILAFGALTTVLYAARERLLDAWKTMSTVAARVGFFVVNFAFWVGSLWGDRIGDHWVEDGKFWDAEYGSDVAFYIPELVFSVGWAAMLIAIFTKSHRGGFLSITSLVFLAIHAYTQFFEMFSAQPGMLIVGGFAAIATSIAAAHFLLGDKTETQGA